MRCSRLAAATLYALGSTVMSSAFAQAGGTLDDATVAAARRSGDAMQLALTTLAPECTLGSADAAAGTWVSTTHAQGDTTIPDQQHIQTAQRYALDTPVETAAVRLVVDRQGWSLLQQVDVRAADGSWQIAWSGTAPTAPAKCDYIRFQPALARAMRVDAVRLVFQRKNGSFTAGNVDVLRPAGAQGGS